MLIGTWNSYNRMTRIEIEAYDSKWTVDEDGNVRMGEEFIIAKSGDYHWEVMQSTVPIAAFAIVLFRRWQTEYGTTPKATV